MKILMVCLGNICRSPLAEGVMQHLIKQEGLDWKVDSAGTGGYHIGTKPDVRSVVIAKINGIDISRQKARKIVKEDFKNFDIIYVMDESNYKNVIALADNSEEIAKVEMLIPNETVPDPYYNDSLFEPVFEMIHTQCVKLLKCLKIEKS
jgi:protein-tyrosine phosphatase